MSKKLFKKIKGLTVVILIGVSLVGSIIVFAEELCELKYFVWCSFSPAYDTQKALVAPYFDEQFYLSRYGKAVEKSGLKPLDHFLRQGWYSHDWRKHTDPNSWFNVTLYQDRLWRKPATFWQITVNPFVDFLKQPNLGEHAQTVDIYAKSDELGRAWLAVEGFIRLDKFIINLHLPPNLDKKELIRFAPQSKRGLKISYDNQANKSFYHNDFIQHPSKYSLTELRPQRQIIGEAPITYISYDFEYLMHRLYNYTNWYRVGRLNPMMINIAHNCDEPLVYTRFGDSVQMFRKFLNNLLSASWHDKWSYPRLVPQDFKDYMVRIADGFDLCLLSTKIPVKNLKLIPGYLYTGINEHELAKLKKFEVSYLLSLGGASFSSYRQRPELNYALRKGIWDHESDLKTPTKFYLSYRDKAKFPKDLQNRVMPTDSKKWIFDSEFSIAIENTPQEDWFSEKLLGCFMALTVPVYIGCPNVLDYFDSRGMIVVRSLTELIEVINSLTPETYQKMLPYLKANRNRTLKLLNLEKEAIAEFFKSKMGN